MGVCMGTPTVKPTAQQMMAGDGLIAQILRRNSLDSKDIELCASMKGKEFKKLLEQGQSQMVKAMIQSP